MGYVVPFDRRVLMDIFVPPGQEGGASPGEMVTVELTRWPTSTRGAIGRVAEVLGDIDAPGVDTEIIIRKYGIPDAHSREAVAEAREAGQRGRRARHSRRAPTSAIVLDGHDRRRARARFRRRDHHREAAERPLLAGRAHRRRVALRAGGQRARSRGLRARRRRCTFPSARCTCSRRSSRPDSCSLNPHVDRLVQSCLMEVDRRGEVVRYEFHDGVINSDERMTYTAVNGILTDRDPGADGALRAAGADVRADARAVPDPERRAAAPRLD